MKKRNFLIVVDVQNDFITGTLRNEEAMKKVSNIVDRINNFNGDCILVTQDTHHDDYLETDEGKKLPVAHCIENDFGWEIEPSVKEALDKANERGILVNFFKKNTFGSYVLYTYFRGVNGLNDFNIDIVGFCTDICVVSNALLLKTALCDSKNVNINVIENCCAGVTPESHEAALKTMEMCQINIV